MTRNRDLNSHDFTMHDIKTMVLFDLEATGLRNSGRPRITELSLVAVNLQDVLGRDFRNLIKETSTHIISELHTSINKFKIETSEQTDKVKVRLTLEALQRRGISVEENTLTQLFKLASNCGEPSNHFLFSKYMS